MDPLEMEMNKAFRKLAEAPSDEQMNAANVCADKVSFSTLECIFFGKNTVLFVVITLVISLQIIKLLQTKSQFDIGRVCIKNNNNRFRH